MANEEKKEAVAADGAAAGKTQGERTLAAPDAADIRRDGWRRLNEAEKEFLPLVKDKVNPHFRSKYASEEAVYKAAKSAILNHGLVLVHSTFPDGGYDYLRTKVVYLGETVDESILTVGPVSAGAQARGSNLTYAKRQNTCLLLAMASEDDDDGEAAQGAANKAKGAEPAPF